MLLCMLGGSVGVGNILMCAVLFAEGGGGDVGDTPCAKLDARRLEGKL